MAPRLDTGARADDPYGCTPRRGERKITEWRKDYRGDDGQLGRAGVRGNARRFRQIPDPLARLPGPVVGADCAIGMCSRDERGRAAAVGAGVERGGAARRLIGEGEGSASGRQVFFGTTRLRWSGSASKHENGFSGIMFSRANRKREQQ